MTWTKHPFVPKSIACLKEGYSFSTLRKDLFAGVTVGIISIPLAMAFAIASGVEPSKGLYTAIVAGFLVSLLGGSRVQIAGPTGAFVVILYATLEKHGFNGLVVASLMAAVILVLMGFFRVGRLIRYVPYPLIVGFTGGLALLIFSVQVKDFFGLPLATAPPDFVGKWVAYFMALPTLHMTTTLVGASTLFVILLLRRCFPLLPWGILGIIFATALVSFLGLEVMTIGDRYGDLPRGLPSPSLPDITWDLAWFQKLLPDAFAIALLSGLEALLSASMADSMIGSRHKPDCELVAHGIGCAASVLFGGIPSTGAVARTAANVKVGGQTPISGMVHAITVFAIISLFGQWVSKIPMAALSAVLMVVAWNMAEAQRIVHLFKAPRGDIAVMLTAFVLTVLVDLSFAVQTAMLLALFLFMRRISEKHGKISSHPLENEKEKEIIIYEVQGPLFFGIADRIRDLPYPAAKSAKAFVLRMNDVLLLDATGMHAISDLLDRCQKANTKLILAGAHEETKRAFERYGLIDRIGKENIFETLEQAIEKERGMHPRSEISIMHS